MNAPIHHVRYARAWNLYTDKDMPYDAKKILEKEMDNAQDSFNWDEFQEFKKTLKGYNKYWESMRTKLFDQFIEGALND